MKSILIVEDEPLELSILVEKLKHEKFNVFAAKNGQEGLQIALKEHPSLILLDVIMPIMDGRVMLDNLRKDEWGKDAKVVLLTNLMEVDKVVEKEKGRPLRVLLKTDYTLQQVVDVIKEELQD